MSRFLLAAALAALAAIAGWSCTPRDRGREPPPRYRNPDLPAIERASDLVRRMTVPEKIAQLMTSAPAVPRLGVPSYDWWNEALHGVARAGRATVFPQAIALGATFDDDLVKRVATVISDEGRAKFNLAQAHGDHTRYHGLTFFSPNVNIFRDPRWGRGQETFGEDPLLSARMGIAFVQGIQGDHPHYWKAVATAKHFAVHSGPEADRHSFDAQVSAHDLADTYLPHFEALARGRVASVMAAYNAVNGQACVANPTLLRDTLRKTWSFLGYVVGDCGAVDDVWQHHKQVATPAEAAAAALRAGTDLDCGRAYRHLDEALARGLVTEKDIYTALGRLFAARFRLGLFDPPERVPWSQLGAETVESAEHLAMARDVAARAVVLLENRAGALPLGPSVHRLAVVGPMADDVPVLLANYPGTPSHPVTLLEGIRTEARVRGVEVGYAAGARLVDTTPGAIAEAVARARDADAVVAFVGLDPRLEGEERDSRFNPGGDRADLDLPAAQRQLVEALLATGKPVIAVVTGGSALAVPWLAARAAAVLYVWYPGAEGGTAVAEVLFGDVNPAGRLPITIYRSAADLPAFASYDMRGRTYRYFDGEPLYPFGYGLSYTTFRYSGLGAVAGKYAAVSVEIQNAGSRAGDEVVEVYVLPRNLPPYAPRRWLAGFTRLTLAAGERRRIRIPFAANALTFVDESGTRRPLPDGDVDVAVGGRQPDRRGGYGDDREGITTVLHLGR